jgi:hypothetical protein
MVGLDLHGLVLDHRHSKHRFFCDVANCPYSDPLLDRGQILSEFSQRGLNEGDYFRAIERYLKSDFYLNCKLSEGFEEFHRKAPTNWLFQVISTAPYNTVDSVWLSLKPFNLSRITKVQVSNDNDRMADLIKSRVDVYIDDKAAMIDKMLNAGIFTIQVSDSSYGRRSQVARLCYDSWFGLLADLQTVEQSVTEFCAKCAVNNHAS